MSSLLLIGTATGAPWLPHRNARLNAWALFSMLHPGAHIFSRVVVDLKTGRDLLSWLQRRREGAERVDRFEEEGYILAFEAKLKRDGHPKLPTRIHVEMRHAGVALDVGLPFFTIWEQCVARWHTRSPPEMPRLVKLIVIGPQNLDAIEEEAGVLLQEDHYLRRRRGLTSERFPRLREDVIRQWIAASGALQRQRDAVERILGQDKDQRLAQLAAEGRYAKLGPTMLDLARQLAHEVAPGDAVLAFYLFRVFQRVAGCTVENECMWKANWLRGTGTDEKAIPGTSSRQKELGELLKSRVFEEDPAKGHSGAAAIATTYRLRVVIPLGPCGPEDMAQALGLQLNSKGRPRRTG